MKALSTLAVPAGAAAISSLPAAPPDITYYERSVIKPPVWIWSIPVYFFVGGVAGAAMMLGFAVQVFGGRDLRRFDERCRWIGAIGGGIGTALLIWDLGRKERFLAMLRVFRPTSPMSVGSWVLALATPLSAGSALLTMSRGRLRELGYAAGAGAGILGMPLGTYTAVLLANTVVPAWVAARRTLPLLFGASSAASLASVLDLLGPEESERELVNRFGIMGRVAELAGAHYVERDVCSHPQVGLPLQRGFSAVLWKAAKVLTASSLACALISGSGRRRRQVSGSLGILGGLAVRMAIFYAGRKSALDPRATFKPQKLDTANQEAPR